MLIGLDAIPLTEPKAGVGHYTFELARALAAASPSDEFELSYPSRYVPIQLREDDEPPLPPNLRASRVEVGALGRHWWSIGLPRYARRRRLELFHGTNYDVPLWRVCPTVLTIHDLSNHLYPATHEARRVRRARRRLPLMARTATMIITPSESVRGEVCEHLRVNPSKVVAVPEAPRRIFSPQPLAAARERVRRLGIEGQFLLAVGTVEPRKDLLTLVRAFEELMRDSDLEELTRGSALEATSDETKAPLHLVVAGGRGWLNDEFFDYVSASPVRDLVHLTGYVSDRDLRALYSSCLAFIYPSVYEGFALPLLEAMACGAPVVASRIPAHCETAGEEAALLFPPRDAQALARTIQSLVADEAVRRRLSDAGRERAARFTWERTAQLTRKVYDEALLRSGAEKRPLID